MAKTATGRLLTEEYRLQQLGVRAQAIRGLARLWPMWSTGDAATYESFITALMLFTNQSRQQVALLAARYYRAFRRAEGIPGTTAIVMAKDLPREALEAALWVTGEAARRRALAAGMPEAQAAANGFAQLSGSVGRHVLNGGRETIMETALHDRRAHGWARVTDGSPCSFCAMLASRGPVYWDSSAASAGFQAHDHCGCHPAPSFKGDQISTQSAVFRAQWDTLTRGLSGEDARNAFRQGFKP